MEDLAFAAVAFVLVAFSLVSARAQSGILTPPMVFVLFGLAADQIGLLELKVGGPIIQLLAEMALVLILFIDAARIDLRRLFWDHDIPIRMLLIGMPLAIIIGSAMALGMFPELGLWGAALLAAILTPTDAALGQATVSNPRLPVRIRQALNVESGLNDGIALPVVIVFLSLAALGGQQETEIPLAAFVFLQLTLGPLAGASVGLVGGRLMARACARGWMTESFQGIAAIGFAILAFALAEVIHGNGFMAAFTGGLAFGHAARSVDRFLLEFGEAEGQLLTLGVFLIFGAALVPDMIAHFDWRMGVFALLALTVMRMLAVRLSLAGMGLHGSTFWFLAWFGPRGVASIVFAMLVIQMPALPGANLILHVAVATVLLSVFAHGITAMPFSRLYSRTSAARRDTVFAEEYKEVGELPTRLSRMHPRGQTGKSGLGNGPES